MQAREPVQLPASVDLAVVGGGIIGLSIAYEACRRGRSTLVIEKSRPGSGATPVAAGMLAPVSEAEPTLPEMIELGLESCRLYPDFVAAIEKDSGLDCRYRPEGSIRIAMDRDHMELLEHRAAEHRDLGLEVTRMNATEVLEIEPGLSPRVVGGILTATDRQVDPRAMSAALVAALANGGATIATASDLLAIERDDAGSIEAVTVAPNGEAQTDGPLTPTTIRTAAVVAAAGAWTNQLLPELAHLPLRPVKGQVVRMRGKHPEEMPLRHVVATPDVYLVPRDDGELVVGASMEEQGFDARPTAGITMDLLVHAWRALPSVYDLEITEINVGFRPTLRDHKPAIGAVGDGLYVATGHFRNGIMLAPVTAKYLVDALETGEAPEGIAPFDPHRFDAEQVPGTDDEGTAVAREHAPETRRENEQPATANEGTGS